MEKGEQIFSHLGHHTKGDRISKPKKKLPINLLKKARREQRNRNERPEKKKRKAKKSKSDFREHEHEALVQATEAELKKILAETDALSDINYDCTPEELLGEIALAEGHGTIVYIERDDLSTLTIVLPQEAPTIANLKRAIESAARVQLQRELKQRYEERLQRRARAPTALLSTNSENSIKKYETTAVTANLTNRNQQRQQEQEQEQEQQLLTGTLLESNIRSTGELVCSTTRNGHHHRSNISWRFLWRAYMLFHMETNQPIDDSNGRRLLSKCGIENATTLKFCKREKYFERKRQK